MPSIGANLRWLVGAAVCIAFEYDTPKYVHIRNKKIGVINRLVQLGIIGYIIGLGYMDCCGGWGSW